MLKTLDSWLLAHIDEFDPFHWNSANEATLRRKATSELAIYLHILTNSGYAVPHELSKHLLTQVQDERYIHLIRRNVSRLLTFGPALTFAIRQIHSRECMALILDILASPIQLNSILSTERSPFKDLELWHLFQSVVPDKNPIDFHDASSEGYLKYPLSIFSCSAADAYALTHSVFYATNFGSYRPDFHNAMLLPPGGDVSLNALILRFFAEKNFDVMVELAITGVICDAIHIGVLVLVRKCLEAQIKSNNVIFTDPSTLGEAYTGMPDRSKYWAQHYHTVVVSGMLFALIERKHKEADVDLIPSDFITELMLLGEGIRCLSSYDLARGADIFANLSVRRIGREFLEIFKGAADFIKSQETSSGDFGYFVDETLLLTKNQGSGVIDFASIQAKTNEACQRFVNRAKTKSDSSTPARDTAST